MSLNFIGKQRASAVVQQDHRYREEQGHMGEVQGQSGDEGTARTREVKKDEGGGK